MSNTLHAPLGPAVVEAWDIVEAVEERLSSANLDLNLLDHYPTPRSSPQHLAHRGFGVQRVRTRNTDEYRDRDLIRVSDEIELTVAYRMRPKDQRASRREGQQLAAAVRDGLTHYGWRTELNLAFEDEAETIHPSGDWVLLTQRFATKRDAWVT